MLYDSRYQWRLSKLVRAGAVAICAVAICLSALTTAKAAKADGVDVIVQVLVDASTAGAPLLGLPVITEEDGEVIKLIVRCAASGATIVKCARQQVIEHLQLPTSVDPLVDCILAGTQLAFCASKDLLNSSGLPPSVQQDAQQLLTCISQTGNLGRCADQAKTSGEQEVLGVIGNLKADAQSDATTELEAAGGGTLRNIISLSKAIDADDWLRVTRDGGTEVYKAAAKIVLNIFLPGVLTTLPGTNVGVAPIVDAIIQARADALGKVTAAAAKGDLGGVIEGIGEAYMSESAIASCAILGEVSEDLKAAVCGPIGAVIHSIAAAGGQITDNVVDAITHPLNIPDDILSLFGDVLNLAGVLIHGPPDPPDPRFCPAPNQYYATSYARCYQRGVRQLSSSPAEFTQLIKALGDRCRDNNHYLHCFDDRDKVNGICSPLEGMFSSHVKQLVSSVNSAANSYQQYFLQFVRELARKQGLAAACNRQLVVEMFLEDCAKLVGVQVPLLGDPNSDNCDTNPSTSFAPVAQRAACERAMAPVDADGVLRDVCAPIFALTGDASLLGETVPPIIIEAIQPPLP
jgi:hypothetical protein